MTVTAENRQSQTGSNETERSLREQDARQLIHDIIGRHEEYFADPSNRLEFIQTQDADSFLQIARYANAKLRGEKPLQLRQDPDEKGAFLPMMHTPSHDDKEDSFRNGYRAIQEYLESSTDPEDKKIEGVAMATEALVIWVHPFNDGNGRTGRFLGKLIEDGATDIDALVAETAASRNRPRVYDEKYQSRQGALKDANNDDLLLDEDEREEMREKAKRMHEDPDAIHLSIKRLLENDAVRQRTLRNVTKAA